MQKSLLDLVGKMTHMEDPDNQTRQVYRLPNEQKVVIQSLEGDPPRALVRRIDGPLAGTVAVCRVSRLEPVEDESD